jgi:uroporphyrinogen-III decarboxylase
LVNGLRALGLRTRSHICGNTTAILPGRGLLGYDIVDCDSMVALADARRDMPNQIILGNVATVEVLRNGIPAQVRATVARCHREAGARYIIGAGCEVPRDTPTKNMQALTDYARQAR